MEYPKGHKEIVETLTKGIFILYSNPLHRIIKDKENFYINFFDATFGYEIHSLNDYIYLTSAGAEENDSRNFVVFLALLCRELNTSGKSFKEEIEFKKFNIDEDIDNPLKNSPKSDIYTHILKPDKGDVKTFLNKWARRNVIEFTNNNKTQFKFTKAVNLFFEYAREVAQEQFKVTNE